MRKVEANDLVLFAINTGELYEDHKALARKKAPIRSTGLCDSWLAHVTGPVLALYGTQIEPVYATLPTRIEVAEQLRDYYERHVAEMAP